MRLSGTWRGSHGITTCVLCSTRPNWRSLPGNDGTKGWNARRNAFVQAYGSDALDASSLLMPLVFFMAPSDPRMLSTVDAVRKHVGAGGLAADGLVYRYDPAAAPDGLPGREGTFNMCSEVKAWSLCVEDFLFGLARPWPPVPPAAS